MTFAAPGWLALLLAVPVLWWLFRKLHGPREILVSSVLLFQGDDDAAPAVRPKRRVDPEFLALAGATVLLALAAAEPRIGLRESARVYVVLDRSYSMDAVAEPGGRSALVRAVERARSLINEVAPGAHVIARTLDGGVAWPPGGGSLETLVHPPEMSPGPEQVRAYDELPGAIGPYLVDAHEQGLPGLVLVTDREIDVPGVVVVGPDRAPLANAGIVGGAFDGDRLTIAVRNYSDEPLRETVRVRGYKPRWNAERSVDVEPRSVGEVLFDPAGESSRLSLRLGGSDGLGEDDAATGFRARAGVGVHVGDSALARVLEPVLSAAGFVSAAEDTAAVHVFRNATVDVAGDTPVLHFAPEVADPASGFRVVPGRRDLTGAAIAAMGDEAEALPQPETTLIAPVRIEGGTPVLRDSHGPLVARLDRVGGTMAKSPMDPTHYVFAFDPADPASTWDRDPSFPVLVDTALRALARVFPQDGHLVTLHGTEGALPDDVPPTPSPAEVVAVIRASDAWDGGSDAGRHLALGAALLLGSTAVFVTRRRSRAAP